MSINWLEVIKALAPVVVAIITFVALRNWQRQDKTKREAEFLDALIEVAHTHIAELPKPITLLEMTKIATIKLRSLAAKGLVFKFSGYTKCQNAVAMPTWHFDRIEAFTARHCGTEKIRKC